MRSFNLPFVLTVATWFFSRESAAQLRPLSSEERMIRNRIMQEAMHLHRTGRHQQALEHVLNALRFQPDASVWFLVATEQMMVGQYVEAMRSAEQCRTLLRDRSHRVQRREFVTRGCNSVINNLQTRVGRIVFTLPANPSPDLRITINMVELPRDQYNIPSMVNPGHVRIEASFQGEVFLERVFTATEGSTTPITISVPTARLTDPDPPKTKHNRPN